jgi:tetratricopeptide (TPR) repeat protein/transcriptional regulator with XRE-family HTH domain
MTGGADPPPFGALVRLHRRRLGMTQEWLAERTELSVRTIRDIERNRTGVPRRRSVSALAEALSLDGPARRDLQEAARRRILGAPPGGVSIEGAPFELPPDAADFTGRAGVTSELVAMLRSGRNAAAVPVVSIAGPAGVGKTTLAVHAAHRLRTTFGDGQLFVRLRTAEGTPRAAMDLLGQLLRSLGVDGGQIPAGVEERAALYRSRLSGRCVLIVLDDAASAPQVRPLLPGISGSAVVVTSRAALTGLAGVRLVDLDALDPEQAIELLARIAGRERVRMDTAAAAKIVGFCDRLPLAVRIAGARLAARPGRPLRWMAGLLADEHRRLDELVLGDLAVRASVGLSYDALGGTDRRAFRRLALLDVPDFASWLVAAVLDTSLPAAEASVERLVDARLLDLVDESGEWPRYRFHDLVRVFARERAQADEPAAERDAAVGRALGAALDLAEHVSLKLPREFPAADQCDAERWIVPPSVADLATTLAIPWFEAEHSSLRQLVLQACADGLLEYAWGIAASLTPFCEVRGYHDELMSMHEIVLHSALRVGNNTRAEAYARLGMSEFYGARSRNRESVVQAARALELFRKFGHRRSEANALCLMSATTRVMGESAASEELSKELLGLALRAGDSRHEATALHNLGMLAMEGGRLQEAGDDFTRAARLYADCADVRGESLVSLRLGALYGALGDDKCALSYLDRCYELCKASSDPVGQGYAQLGRYEIYARQGRDTDAAHALADSLRVFRGLRQPLGEARALLRFGEVLHQRNDYPAAERVLRRALRLIKATDARVWQATIRTALGDLLAELGRAAEAEGQWKRALPAYERAGAPQAETLRGRLRELAHAAARNARE